MPVQPLDIIQATFIQRQGLEQVKMVFQYRATTVGSNDDLGSIMTSWAAALFPAINTVQHFQIENVGWEAINLTNGVDIASGTRSGRGAIEQGDIMPPFVAAGVRLSRTSRITRNGQKRIGGIAEVSLDGGIFNSNFREAFEANVRIPLAGGFEFTEPPTAGTRLAPVIVGKLPNGLPDLTRVQLVQNAVLNVSATSQTSRKP